MTVDELEALIAKVESQVGKVLIKRDEYKRTWSLVKTGLADEDLYECTLREVVAKLREWATPPKPETLTIEVPFSWAWSRALNEYFKEGTISAVDAACVEAIKPWSQSCTHLIPRGSSWASSQP